VNVSEAIRPSVDAEKSNSAVVTGFHPEPRCRVCRNDGIRKRVNDLLALGAPYAGIVRTLTEYNTDCEERDRVTIDSLRNHAARHFPVQNAARATYRDILERRAHESAVDFVEGLTTAITPIALYEVIMVRGWEKLVDPTTEIDVSTAMAAAGKLQAMIESRAESIGMAEIVAQTNRIIEAVRSTVPPELWPAIVSKLESDGKTDQPVIEEDWESPEPDDFTFDSDDE
jgi:hypothetical protein